jgi:hypothetical protein
VAAKVCSRKNVPTLTSYFILRTLLVVMLANLLPAWHFLTAEQAECMLFNRVISVIGAWNLLLAFVALNLDLTQKVSSKRSYSLKLSSITTHTFIARLSKAEFTGFCFTRWALNRVSKQVFAFLAPQNCSDVSAISCLTYYPVVFEKVFLVNTCCDTSVFH